MAWQRTPNMAVSLILLIGGALLAYYIFRINGFNSGIPASSVWAGLSRTMRAMVLAGFVASAYGLGAVINNLARKD